MPRRPDRDIIAELLDKFEPTVRLAFLDAIQTIRSSIILRVIVERLERNDLEGAVAAMQIDATAFARFELAIYDTYTGGGMAFVESLPRVRGPDGNRVLWRFGVRNEPGEMELRQHSATLVTRTTEDMKQAIRASLEEGLRAGQNPTRTVLEVVGRVNRATGRREGGILGLTSQQERFVASARAELASGDPDALRNYLTRKRRDKRFDRTVAKALREGKPLPTDAVDKIVGRYSDSLLKLRGDAIGLNETMNALGKSRDDAMGQQIASGKVDAQDVTKTWHHSAQEHPRLHHVAMNGKSVGYGERFQLPDGTLMKHPHDPDGGAKHNLFCKCWCEYRVNYIDALVRRQKAA